MNPPQQQGAPEGGQPQRRRAYSGVLKRGFGNQPRPASPRGGPTSHPARPPGHGSRRPASSDHGRSHGRGRDFARRGPPPPRQFKDRDLGATDRVVLPSLDADTVRVVPLGGVEEVGRNMMLVELDEGIIIVDAGFQFVSEGVSPGIDYILPNTRYLEENKDRILGLFITHGHLDHIGGIPYMIDRIGNPPIYTQYLTSLMIKKRQEEFPHLPQLKVHVLEPGGRVTIGNAEGKRGVTVKSFPVTHSIPDSMGIAIETKHGNIVISGDLRLEHEEGIPSEKEVKNWGAIGREKNLLFIADSTNAEKDGFSIPEARVYETIERIISTVKGRLIIGTFSSQFERMVHIIKVCEKLGKKIVTEGRSIKTNIEIAERGSIFTPKPGTIIRGEEITDYPADKIVIIATGSQGEESAALMRIATKKHKFITFTERDTVVLSSSVIPGNEMKLQKLKYNIRRPGVHFIQYR